MKTNFTVGISTSSLEISIHNKPLDGIGHYTKQLIENLEKQQIKCKCFSFKAKTTDKSLEYSLPFHHSFEKSMLLSAIARGKICRFNPRVDIFHCTDHKLIPMQCPTVATVYDAIPMIHPEWCGGIVKSMLRRYFFKLNAKFADHIITISKHSATDLIKYLNIKEKDISVIPCAVDDIWFNNIDEQHLQTVLNKYDLSVGYFLSVGTIQPRKNFSNLIDAYLALPWSIRQERKLVIVGKYGWNSGLLVKKMQVLQSEGTIVWLSNVNSDEDLRCIYQGAGVFVFPSLYEGFGIPLLEAFASGVPVVCSNRTSLPEVSNGAALEVNPESIGELSDAMQLLVSNTKERKERIKQGSVRVAQMRWVNTVEKTINVYKQVLGNIG